MVSMPACAIIAGVDGDYETDGVVGATTIAKGGGVVVAGGGGGAGGDVALNGGNASSPSIITDCGGTMFDIARDPRHCGKCDLPCAAGEYCSASACTCRPGYILVAGKCVDLASSSTHCGFEGRRCPTETPVCQDGECVASCSRLGDKCSTCYDTTKDELHCGTCKQNRDQCETTDVCVGGSCASWRVGASCTSCPCADCDDNTVHKLCCLYPGAPGDHVICVAATKCPG